MSRYSGSFGRSATAKRLIIGALGIEVICFFGCYSIFVRMNSSRDFRLHVHNNYPSVLDQFYKIHEWGSESKLRDKDMYVWSTTGKVL